MWEGGVRAAGFVAGGWPGINSDRRGSNITAMIHVSDWLPTLATLVGGKATGGPGTGLPALLTADKAPYPGWVGNGTYALDGYDVWPTINNGAPSPRSVVLHNIDPVAGDAGIRVSRYKLLVKVPPSPWYPNPDDPGDIASFHDAPVLAGPGAAVVPTAGPLKGRDTYLFDVQADPYERVNLAGSMPDKVNELAAQLKRFPGVPCRYPSPDPGANPHLPGRTGAWAPWRNDTTLPAGTEGASSGWAYRLRHA